MMQTSLDPTAASTVLVVAAHPDDADISGGGTIARWAREGREIHYVLCTSGNRGSGDPEMAPERLGKIRRRSSGQRPRSSALPGLRSSVMRTARWRRLLPSDAN